MSDLYDTFSGTSCFFSKFGVLLPCFEKRFYCNWHRSVLGKFMFDKTQSSFGVVVSFSISTKW